ncbi:YeeE/YedE thiosulfate transporter family protein [Photobacterium rosenbergii]|uniref:YeeE/YedE thiosulfate transporter family protein n=1 Tax=Photobacterium rosenbergii TaxID=294936 RepID=UPI0021BD29DF|nr:YeeE/YedE thiosulfate transporter family protein [Photobacterium rosenbergii]
MLQSAIEIFLAALVGWLAQRTGLCMVRGVSELLERRPSFLLAILCCGFWYWLIVPFTGQEWLPFLANRFDGTIHFILGGLLFGLGAALNKGCSISTISKLASGHFYMLATVVGWIFGWLLLPTLTPPVSYQPLENIDTPSLPALLVIAIGLLFTILKTSATQRKLLFGVIFFGITASTLTLMEPQWSPSQLLKDISYTIYHSESQNWPELERYLILLGLVVGMAFGAKSRLPIKAFEVRAKQIASHLFAGVIMGLGASLALGGNDSQLLIALPAFSPAGLVAIISIILGIAAGLATRKVYKRRKNKKNRST